MFPTITVQEPVQARYIPYPIVVTPPSPRSSPHHPATSPLPDDYTPFQDGSGHISLPPPHDLDPLPPLPYSIAIPWMEDGDFSDSPLSRDAIAHRREIAEQLRWGGLGREPDTPRHGIRDDVSRW